MSRAEIEALVARVEAATGADGRLDAELTCSLKLRGLRPAEPDDFDGKYGYSPHNIKTETGFLMARCYTSSVDEVLALVAEKLPGWTRQVTEFGDGGARAVVWRGEKEEAWGRAATPALALLAACLRARQAGAGEGATSTNTSGEMA